MVLVRVVRTEREQQVSKTNDIFFIRNAKSRVEIPHQLTQRRNSRYNSNTYIGTYIGAYSAE